MPASALWAVAAEVRRQLRVGGQGPGLEPDALRDRTREVLANGRLVQVAWDLGHAVHDDAGQPVLGVCETDPDLPGTALVSVNARMVAGRPDLALSTAAHELGHVLFDVPATLGAAGRRFRAVTADPDALLDPAAVLAERRANEFMGALLVPAVTLHVRLLGHARAEGLRTVHAAHHGRQGSRILAKDNPPEAVAGVVAALAGDFGVSDSFVRVRLARYRLVEGGLVR
ncbi:MAG: ImmA/IrrE family metallo-endopeptidase [Fimbriimonadaceae bacterium]|nr:ImmA/IrrE family metallo-endopeptidase [Fimbriimonadaceae bacterium]